MFHRVFPVALLLVLLSCRTAPALWIRSESVEWKTDTADIIVIGVVTTTKKIKPLNELWDSQMVSFKVVEAVKGRLKHPPDFRQDFGKADERNTDPDQFRKGDRLLLFLSRKRAAGNATDRQKLTVTDKFNLTRKNSEFLAYTNERAEVADTVKLLELVRKRQKKGQASRRGLILTLPFHDIMHYLVITAEPKYKPGFVKQLRSEFPDDQADAIFNLASYPGEETERLLRPHLQSKHEGVKKAAHIAMCLIKNDSKLPTSLHGGSLSFSFGTGFENDTYFPHGNLRRWADILQAPPRFDFLEGRTPVSETYDWDYTSSYYSIQADFAEMRRRVQAELLAKGFRVARDVGLGSRTERNSVQYKRERDFVTLYDKIRYLPGSRHSISIKGWVGMQVRIEQRPR